MTNMGTMVHKVQIIIKTLASLMLIIFSNISLEIILFKMMTMTNFLVVYLAKEPKTEVLMDLVIVDLVSAVLDLVQAYLNLNLYFRMMIFSKVWEVGLIFHHLGHLLLEMMDWTDIQVLRNLLVQQQERCIIKF